MVKEFLLKPSVEKEHVSRTMYKHGNIVIVEEIPQLNIYFFTAQASGIFI